MKYGKVIHPKELLDQEGSSRQIIETIRNGEKQVATRYEQRVRVSNKAEELAEYAKLAKNHDGQNIEFKVEKKRDPNKDYYHVIKIWEE